MSDNAVQTTDVGFLARVVPGATSTSDAMKKIWQFIGVPIVSMLIFLFLWQQAANNIKTSLGNIPGPVAVIEEAVLLWEDHQATRAKADAFYERQEKRNAAKLAKNPDAEVKWRTYTGKPTYLDQIWTSIKTVFMGFILATIVAVPLGIACGLSKRCERCVQPADPNL